MKKLLGIFILVAVITVGAFAIAPAMKAIMVGDVEGTLMAENEPLPGILVSFGQYQATDVTDSEGRFLIKSIPVGAYRVTAILPVFFQLPAGEVTVGKGRNEIHIVAIPKGGA